MVSPLQPLFSACRAGFLPHGADLYSDPLPDDSRFDVVKYMMGGTRLIYVDDIKVLVSRTAEYVYVSLLVGRMRSSATPFRRVGDWEARVDAHVTIAKVPSPSSRCTYPSLEELAAFEDRIERGTRHACREICALRNDQKCLVLQWDPVADPRRYWTLLFFVVHNQDRNTAAFRALLAKCREVFWGGHAHIGIEGMHLRLRSSQLNCIALGYGMHHPPTSRVPAP